MVACQLDIRRWWNREGEVYIYQSDEFPVKDL